jgi:hypothetical protein
MAQNILYLGDTILSSAAAYLAGLMTHWGWEFEYVPSELPATAAMLEPARSLYVLSDYPAAQLAPELQTRILDQVAQGAGLLMCGGWESFHGCGGDWDTAPVARALPVQISGEDDRVNCDHPVLIKCANRESADHPICTSLDWDGRPPLIGGYNRVTAKPDAQVLLEAVHIEASRQGDGFVFDQKNSDPLLVVGAHGSGRTAALTTDVAPHWVGPLIDWGSGDTGRVTGHAPGGEEIEVGADYARFLKQLLGWVSQH